MGKLKFDYSEAGLVRYTLTGDIPNPGFQDYYMQPSWTLIPEP